MEVGTAGRLSVVLMPAGEMEAMAQMDLLPVPTSPDRGWLRSGERLGRPTFGHAMKSVFIDIIDHSV